MDNINKDNNFEYQKEKSIKSLKSVKSVKSKPPSPIIDEHANKMRNEFEEWKKFFKTNLQPFFDNLSNLHNLNSLNLSNNKIQFFDIDPFSIKDKNGYPNLKTLDLSYNKIEEGIGLLLVMNLPALENIDITKNPIIERKEVFESVEYEIFKNKNIFLQNTEKTPVIIPYLNGKKNVQLHQPYYSVKPNKITNLNKFRNTVKKRVNDIKRGKIILT